MSVNKLKMDGGGNEIDEKRAKKYHFEMLR